MWVRKNVSVDRPITKEHQILDEDNTTERWTAQIAIKI